MVLLGTLVIWGHVSLPLSVSGNTNPRLTRLELEIRRIELGRMHLKLPFLWIKMVNYWEFHVV